MAGKHRANVTPTTKVRRTGVVLRHKAHEVGAVIVLHVIALGILNSGTQMFAKVGIVFGFLSAH